MAEGTADDLRQLLRGVQLKAKHDPKAIAQGCGKLACARGGADQREMRQVQPHGTRGGTLANHDIQCVILHRRVENLLHSAGEPVDFVNKQHIPGVEVGKYGSQVARAVNGRA